MSTQQLIAECFDYHDGKLYWKNVAHLNKQYLVGKEAVNEDGSIKPQGIDTSFLVGHLVACIQELKAEVDALKAQLENK